MDAENFKALRYIIERDIDTLREKFFEKLFMELFKEKQEFTSIGSYWDRKGENQINIVAVDDLNKNLCCEVKLQKKILKLKH